MILTTVKVEVWPVTADPAGLWLLSGSDALRSGPVKASGDAHGEAEALLEGYGALDGLRLLHSTSWRSDGESVVLTYIAVVGCSDLATAMWPEASPISPAVPEAVGKPYPADPAGPPVPRYIDVLMHGLRHLSFLLRTDSQAREALCGTWHDRLQAFAPSLAGMYEHGSSPVLLDDAAALDIAPRPKLRAV